MMGGRWAGGVVPITGSYIVWGFVSLTSRLFLRPCGVRGTGYPVKPWRRGDMARKTSVFGFSVSPALAREYERLAEREGDDQK